MTLRCKPGLGRVIDAIVESVGNIGDTISNWRVNGSEIDTSEVLVTKANEIMTSTLKATGRIASYLSGHGGEVATNNNGGSSPTSGGGGRFAVVFDAIDNPENLECDQPVGTLFGIYQIKDGEAFDVSFSAARIVCSGYALYSSSLTLAIALNQSLSLFTRDPQLGKFLPQGGKRKMRNGNPKRKIFVDMSNLNSWRSDAVRTFFSGCADESGAYNHHFNASFVSGLHASLTTGCALLYPSDKRNPNGSLNMVRTCIPAAFLISTAGGFSVCEDGSQILKKKPKSTEETSSLLIGCSADVIELQRLAELNEQLHEVSKQLTHVQGKQTSGSAVVAGEDSRKQSWTADLSAASPRDVPLAVK